MERLILTTSSPVYKLFHYTYHCRLPSYSLYSFDEIETYGIRKWDEDVAGIAYQPNDIILTIACMSKYYSEDIPLQVCDIDRYGEIYEIITGHIYMWYKHIQECVSKVSVPIDDLEILDRMADHFYCGVKPDYSNIEQLVLTPLGLPIALDRVSHIKDIKSRISYIEDMYYVD